MRELLKLEGSALRRLFSLPAALAIALLGAEVGALALCVALTHARAAFLLGDAMALADASPAVMLGLDLMLILGSLGFGAAASMLTRPSGTSFIAAARSSGGTITLAAVAGMVLYALTLGYAQLIPQLLGREASLSTEAAVLALALAPALLLAWVLCSAALVGVVLVGRGVPPSRALASGLDHVLRRPRALFLWLLHAGVAVLLVVIAAAVPGLARLLLLAPLLSLAGLWAVAAFDLVLGADARLATG